MYISAIFAVFAPGVGAYVPNAMIASRALVLTSIEVAENRRQVRVVVLDRTLIRFHCAVRMYRSTSIRRDETGEHPRTIAGSRSGSDLRILLIVPIRRASAPAAEFAAVGSMTVGMGASRSESFTLLQAAGVSSATPIAVPVTMRCARFLIRVIVRYPLGQ
jgi:hypothetical protein